MTIMTYEQIIAYANYVASRVEAQPDDLDVELWAWIEYEKLVDLVRNTRP